LRGGQKQKLILGVGLPQKFLFVRAHPNPWPTGSTPPNGGICFENWEGACKQKFLLRVCLSGKIKFFGLTPSWGPQGLPHQMGVYGLIIGWGSANKSCSSGWVCLVKFNF